MVDYQSDLEATLFIDYLYNNIRLRKVLSDRRTKNTGGPLSVYTPRMQCIDPPHPLPIEYLILVGMGRGCNLIIMGASHKFKYYWTDELNQKAAFQDYQFTHK